MKNSFLQLDPNFGSVKKMLSPLHLPALLSSHKKYDNAVQVVISLLGLLKIPVTSSSISTAIVNHPDYPSLLAISDSLKLWNIKSMALKVKPDRLMDLPVPFIAHLKTDRGTFAVINRITAKFVEYLDASGKPIQKAREIFIKEWRGVVLLVEPNIQSGERDYAAEHKKEMLQHARIPFILMAIGILCLVYLLGLQHSKPLIAYLDALLLVKLFGSITAALLLWYEIDNTNPVVQQICHVSKGTNCDAVLHSKGSKLFGLTSWSEVGFFYFVGGFIFLLSSGANPPSYFAVLAWMNLFALPYTVFSIYYQWRVVKQWCPLCLLVQFLLIAEFTVCYFGYWESFINLSFTFSTLMSVLTSFGIPILFWVFVKHNLLKAHQSDVYKKELARLKFNPELFHVLLIKQKKIVLPPTDLGITLGNPNASTTIVKVANLFCHPCAKAHLALMDILQMNEDVKAQIIFTTKDYDKGLRTEPILHLLALNGKSRALTNQALLDWYGAEKRDYDAFSIKYPLNGELKSQGVKLQMMESWCEENSIAATPTFFVNGYQLPKEYSIDDIKYLL